MHQMHTSPSLKLHYCASTPNIVKHIDVYQESTKRLANGHRIWNPLERHGKTLSIESLRSCYAARSRTRRSCSVTTTLVFSAVALPWRSKRFQIRRTFASRFIIVKEQYNGIIDLGRTRFYV